MGRVIMPLVVDAVPSFVDALLVTVILITTILMTWEGW
jgi:hypothetical protein